MIFQIDSELVKTAYKEQRNYLIQYDNRNPSEYCAVYFSSHNIYYPNTEESFRKSIQEKNYFEWKTRCVPYAQKHIFIRDIQKQWYLCGINEKISSPEKVWDFLKKRDCGV